MVRDQPDPRFVSHLTRDTYAIILAGGRGSRLEDLTDWRAKPAVPFGGKFRIIDFTLSNCVNSGVRRIGVRHAIQGAQSDPAPAARLEFPRWPHPRVDRHPARAATDQGILVPRHRRRGVPEPRHPAHRRLQVRARALGRSCLQDGLRASARRPRVAPRRPDGGLRRGAASRKRRLRRHAGRRRTPRQSASWKNRRIRRRYRDTKVCVWPAWASTCSMPTFCSSS